MFKDFEPLYEIFDHIFGHYSERIIVISKNLGDKTDYYNAAVSVTVIALFAQYLKSKFTNVSG